MIQAAQGTGFRAGDLVVGIVRRRDPFRARPWRGGSLGHVHGTAGTPSGASEGRPRLWRPSATASTPNTLVAVEIPPSGFSACCSGSPPLVAKAWDHIEKIGRRAAWAPQKVLITGAGPIGLLAALLATQRGYTDPTW